MRKELRPVHDLISCDLCERTILKGERIETFVGGGGRQRVCELCGPRALRSGWLRESELERQTPDREHRAPRPSLWSRAVSWAEEQGIWGAPPPAGDEADAAPPSEAAPTPNPRPAAAEASHGTGEPMRAIPAARGEVASREDADRAALEDRRRRAAARAEERRAARESQVEADGVEAVEESGDAAAMARRPVRVPPTAGLRDLLSGKRREPRPVETVPPGRWGKIERALELFNGSEHRRTMAGVARTLGEPLVCAAPLETGTAAREVGITVAWEISWYRFKVDIDDMEPSVVLLDRGNELEDLDESLRAWNVAAQAEGRLELAAEAVS